MIDIIWNVSLICPWNCEFCCTDAAYVNSKNQSIIISDHNLRRKTTVTPKAKEIFKSLYPNVTPNKFDLALIERQILNIEPTLSEKKEIIENLPKSNLKIDFAGGDPLACYENLLLIEYTSQIIGKENISITSTGHSIQRYGLKRVSNAIGEFEFTFDEPIGKEFNRPSGYNNSNLFIAKEFSKEGIKTKAQIPIHNGNIGKSKTKSIYQSLKESDIDEILIMRTFPVGRGSSHLKNNQISKDDLISTIQTYKELASTGCTKVRLQCALQHLFVKSHTNPCDAISTSYGINFQGKLLISAWANDHKGRPLSDDFVLGDLKKQSFHDIIRSRRVAKIKSKLNNNHGHCKIFSYYYGGKNFEAIFSKSDPLYRET